MGNYTVVLNGSLIYPYPSISIEFNLEITCYITSLVATGTISDQYYIVGVTPLVFDIPNIYT